MCFSLAHLWQFLEAPALVGEGDKAEVEWLLEKLEKLAIRRGNCNEKMILNRANTILPWLSFLLSRRKQVMTSCLGFFASLWQSQLGKSWRKMSPLSLDSIPGVWEEKSPVTVRSLDCCSSSQMTGRSHQSGWAASWCSNAPRPSEGVSPTLGVDSSSAHPCPSGAWDGGMAGLGCHLD